MNTKYILKNAGNGSITDIKEELRDIQDNYLDIVKYYGEEAALCLYQDLLRKLGHK